MRWLNIGMSISMVLTVCGPVFAQQAFVSDAQTTPAQAQAVVVPTAAAVQPAAAFVRNNEDVLYSLGAEDVVQITVQRHPEFTGTFPVNMEGKIQYGFVGDVEVTGLTKKQLEEKLSGLIAKYVVNPELSVTIVEYRSKSFYVVGEVNHPGKIYMRSETIPVREAVIQAGLPLISAALRKCRIITPDKNGKPRTKKVDLYAILYGGNLRNNIELRSGDVLYVPSTVMAKVFRTIAPITEPVASAASAQTGLETLNSRPTYGEGSAGRTGR